MRNYGGFRNNSNEYSDRKFNGRFDECQKKKKLIVEDNTIYEIDLDCLECCKEKDKD